MTCAHHLGLLRKKTLVFNNETETSLFADYQVYAYRPRGFNMAELYLRLNRERLDGFDMELLIRMSAARYSVLVVDSLSAEGALQVKDIFRGLSFLLVNNGLSQTARPGDGVAGHILSFDDFFIQSGAALPVSRDLMKAEEPLRALQNLDRTAGRGTAMLDPTAGAKLARATLSAAIRLGYTDRVTYAGHEGAW